MSPDKIGSSINTLNSADNKSLSEDAQEYGNKLAQQNSTEQLTQPINSPENEDGTKPIDLNSGETETKIAHNEFESLTNAELQNRSREATEKLTSLGASSSEFEAQRDKVVQIALERAKRYNESKENGSENATAPSDTLSSAPTQKIERQPVFMAPQPQNEQIEQPWQQPEQDVAKPESTYKPTKHNKDVAKKVAASALAVTLGATGLGVAEPFINKEQANANPTNSENQNRIQQHERAKVGSPESYQNQFANADGSAYNPEKGTSLDFTASTGFEQARAAGDIQAAKESLKDTSMQVEALAGHLNALTNEQDRADLGIKGMTLKQINEKLENDEAFRDQTSAKFLDLVQKGIGSFATLEAGNYDNLYMNFINQDARAEMGNVSLNKCTTYENGTAVFILTTENGSVITFKSCWQPVVKQGGWGNTTEDIPEVDPPQPVPPGPVPPGPVPPGPVPPGPVPPGPTPEPEWGKSGDTHAGEGVFNKDLVNPATEVTEWQSDHANDGNKGGQSDIEVNHGIIDQGGNQQQQYNPDRNPGGQAKDHSNAEEEQRFIEGDF